jgi:hypothetical protein
VFIMAARTALSMDLLHRRRWRSFLPLLVPALFVVLSGFITQKLDTKYESYGARAETRIQAEALREDLPR